MNTESELQEFYENGHDPLWRLVNIYYIIDKNGQRIPYTTNYVQNLINKRKEARRIILKARQFGVSTNEILLLADYTFFNSNVTTGIIAHEQGAMEKLFRIVKRAYEFMPPEIRPEIAKGGGSVYEMYFPEINSRIYCDLEVRGDTLQRLHVSEAAFMKDSARLKATLQAVPLNGRVTIETTPNGMANFFYDMWTDPDSIYTKLFYPWYLFPGYRLPVSKKIALTDEEVVFCQKAKDLFGVKITHEQIAFRRFKRQELKTSTFDKKRVPFEQEYPEDDKSCFLATGNPVIDAFKIDAAIRRCKGPIREVGPIKIYKEPVKGRIYVIGADTAEGVEADASAAVVLDIETLEVVAVLHTAVHRPEEFAQLLTELAKIYTSSGMYPPMIAVERNNHGHTVLFALNQLNYPNIYAETKYDDLGNEETTKQGWGTTAITRPVMLDYFISSFENDMVHIYDTQILSECLTLINNNGKIEAASGKHDDLIIALCIALQVKPSGLYTIEELRSKINL